MRRAKKSIAPAAPSMKELSVDQLREVSGGLAAAPSPRAENEPDALIAVIIITAVG